MLGNSHRGGVSRRVAITMESGLSDRDPELGSDGDGDGDGCSSEDELGCSGTRMKCPMGSYRRAAPAGVQEGGHEKFSVLWEVVGSD